MMKLRMKCYYVLSVALLFVLSTITAQAQVTYIFQEGLGGYEGTHDTYFQTGDAGAINGESTEWEWDGEDAGGYNFGLLSFDDIVGTNPGQVPPDSTLVEAILILNITNEGDSSQIATQHDLLIPFDESSDLIDFGDGFEPRPGIDYDEAIVNSIPGPPAGTVLELDVTSSIQKILAGEDFFGWVFIPNGSNGVGVSSKEAATGRPQLVIRVEGQAAPEVTRVISKKLFEPNQSIAISLNLSLAEGSSNTTIVENLPSGWSASNISDGGTFAGGSVTWSLPGFSGQTTLTYDAVAPGSPSGDVTFDGVVNETFFVLGDNSIFFLEPKPVGIFSSHRDIGDTGQEGSASLEGDVYNVRGSGTDIWGGADEFHYLFSQRDGSFRFSANIDGFNETSTNEWSKITIMIRDNLSPGSPHVNNLIRGSDGGFVTQWRPAQGAGSVGSDLIEWSQHLGETMLERVGDNFYSYYRDQATGELVLDQVVEVVMGDEVLVGLGVTSHERGTITLGEYSNIAITPFSHHVERNFPVSQFLGGRDIQGIELTAVVRDGESPDLTILESPPEGWAVSNIQTSAGTGSVNADGDIEWSLSGATGNQTLTYNLAVPGEAITGSWSGESSDGTETLPVAGQTTLDAVPPLFETGNVLAVGVWNDNNTSSDLAVTAELVDNNGNIYVQDTSAAGGWPSGTLFRWKVVFYEDGSGEEEPGWQLRDFDDSDWIEETDVGFTIGYGGNNAENGEILLVPTEETVYTRSIFDAVDYENITSVTIKMAADDEAVAWLNGVFIGFTASGTSDRGEGARDYVYDTTIAGGAGGLENGSNPSVYTGGGTIVLEIPVNLADSEQTPIIEWSIY